MSQQTGFLHFDGRRIAYATVGDGRRTLVLPAWWVSHVVDDWGQGSFRRFVEGLAQGYRVVRYDRPGTGLSDRERPLETLTLEYEVALLESVIDHHGAGRVALFGVSCGACSSALYTARHPERVDRVVLYGSYAHGADLGTTGARAALADLVRSGWGLGSRMLADVFGPSLLPADRDAFASYQRRASTPEAAADLLELVFAYDVREVLPTLRVPTLVVHRDRDRAIPLQHGQEVAGLVPGAELVTLAGDDHLPWQGDGDSVRAAVSSFLGLAPPPREPAPEAVEELSGREREVLRLVGEGLSDSEIAARLVLSPHTVHRHVANIRRKLGLRSRSAAAVAATRAGLI